MRLPMLLLVFTSVLVVGVSVESPACAKDRVGPDLIVRVAVDATVDSSLVRLSDIAEPVSKDEQLWALISEVVVSCTDRRWVTRSKIEQRLEAAGVPAGSIEVSGAAICLVQKKETGTP